MVVAVIAVRMVQVPGDKVVGVASMRDLLVTAVVSVRVTGIVAVAGVIRGTGVRVGLSYGKDVLVVMIAVSVMHVTVVQIVGMPLMQDSGMPAVRTMGMVVLVGMVVAHEIPPGT